MKIPASVLSRPGVKVQRDRQHTQWGALEVRVSMKTYGTNRRDTEHYMARHKRTMAEHLKVDAALFGRELPRLPAVVTMIRHGMKVMDDDNLRAATKATRDSIANLYNVDDGGSDIKWEYAQEPVKHRKDQGVTIRIRSV